MQWPGGMREGKAHAAGEKGGKYIGSAAWLTEFYLGGVWVNGIIF